MAPCRLAVLAHAQDPRAALLEADRAASDTAARRGLAVALQRVGAERLVYLHPGAPVVQGQEGILRLLESIPDLASVDLQWAPLHAELSGDSAFGVTFGIAVSRDRAARPEAPLRFGNYLSAWRWESGRWHLLALAHVGATLPAATGSAPNQSTSEDISPSAEPFAEADRRFAAKAARDGAPRAFEMFAASDAVTFPGAGELTRGPAAIRASLERGGRDATWTWHPIAGDAAADGTLAFTVGLAEIRRTRPDGTPATTRSKYLSLWRREPQGTIRFLADGGSGR